MEMGMKLKPAVITEPQAAPRVQNRSAVIRILDPRDFTFWLSDGGNDCRGSCNKHNAR